MKIYVGNLHHNASDQELHDLFTAFGTVLSVIVPMNRDGKTKGHGYIEMKENEDGRTAVQKLNGINFMNQFLEIYEVD